MRVRVNPGFILIILTFEMTYSVQVPPTAILVNGPLARISATIEIAEAGEREVNIPPIIRLDTRDKKGAGGEGVKLKVNTHIQSEKSIYRRS